MIQEKKKNKFLEEEYESTFKKLENRESFERSKVDIAKNESNKFNFYRDKKKSSPMEKNHDNNNVLDNINYFSCTEKFQKYNKYDNSDEIKEEEDVDLINSSRMDNNSNISFMSVIK